MKDRSVKRIGKLPVNSRIYVSYNEEGKPPKITFKYPKRNAKEQVSNSSPAVLPAMFIAGILTLCFWAVFAYLNDNNPTINGGSYGDDTIFVNYTFRGEQHLDAITYHKYGTFITPRVDWEANYTPIKSMLMAELADALIVVVLFIIFLAIFTRIIAKIFMKTSWGHKTFPELNKMMHNEKFSATFKDAPNGIIEIPLFKNMYLDYRAVGEFSKHLKTFEIIEHPFNRIIKKRGKDWRFWKRKKKKDKNIFLWKAIFTFAQPIQKTKGSFLEIRWT